MGSSVHNSEFYLLFIHISHRVCEGRAIPVATTSATSHVVARDLLVVQAKQRANEKMCVGAKMLSIPERSRNPFDPRAIGNTSRHCDAPAEKARLIMQVYILDQHPRIPFLITIYLLRGRVLFPLTIERWSGSRKRSLSAQPRQILASRDIQEGLPQNRVLVKQKQTLPRYDFLF